MNLDCCTLNRSWTLECLSAHSAASGTSPNTLHTVTLTRNPAEVTVWRQQHFADDSQIHRSCQPSDIDQTVLNVQDCVSDIRYWMIDNKLQPNEDKTEAMLFDSSELHDAPASLSIWQTTVTFSDSDRNLGFYPDKELSVKQHSELSVKQQAALSSP